MIDPTGALIAELRTANIASGRVYGGQAPPGVVKAPSGYQRFVVLTRIPVVRLHRTPLQEVRLALRCYGSTDQDAAALYGEVSDVLDNAGPRVSASSVPLYQTLDEGSQGTTADPGTNQPYEEGTIAVWAGTEALA